MKKFPKAWAWIGLLFVFSTMALAVDTPTRLTNAVIIGNGVAGTKTLTYDIGGSNPLIESVAGVLKLSTNGTNLMSVPAATDTFVGKATTDVFTNKTIGSGGLPFNGATSGSTTLVPTAVAGSTTITMPAATDTMCVLAASQTLSGKTYSAPAFTGAMTATGDLTETKAGGIAWLLNNTASTGNSVLTLRSGDGTTSTNNQYIEFLDSDSVQNVWDVGHVGNNNLTFYDQTKGQAAAQILLAGAGADNNLVVNSTTTSPAGILNAYSGSGSYAGVFGQQTGNSNVQDVFYASYSKTSGNRVGTEIFMRFGSGTGTDGTISWNAASTVAYNTSSDRRLKKDIVDFPDGLKILRQVQPRRFTWRAEGGEDDRGFIAQELKKVYPFPVSGSEKGDPKKDPMSVDYGKLTPLLTAAAKQIDSNEQALEAKVATLEARLAKLEAKVALLEATPKQ